MKRLFASAGICCIVFLFACKKNATTDLRGDWLFPIAKGSISLNSLAELKNLQYHLDVPALSIGQPLGVPVSSPGLNINHVGPFGVEITNWIHRIDVDSLEFSGKLNNLFPVPIGAGTRVTMRTSRDTTGIANIAGVTTILSNVLPGANFSFDIKVTNKSLGDSVYFFLENFTSPAYSNVTFTANTTTLDITLKVITASFIEIYTNRTFSSVDTAGFDPGDADQTGSSSGGVLSDTSTTGVINVFMDNTMPTNVNTQLYFLDASHTHITDSLFVSSLDISGILTNAAGDPLNTISTINKIPVTRKKIDNIKQSRYVVSRFLFNTIGYSGLYVAANRTPKLNIQFTGDLNMHIRF